MSTTTNRLISGLLLTGLSFASTACAAQVYRSGPPREVVYERGIERRAYDIGFREGVEQGRNDARRNRDFSFGRHNEYRDADDGYHRGDGDREFYRRSFREGFQAGYSAEFNRVARDRRY